MQDFPRQKTYIRKYYCLELLAFIQGVNGKSICLGQSRVLGTRHIGRKTTSAVSTESTEILLPVTMTGLIQKHGDVFRGTHISVVGS